MVSIREMFYEALEKKNCATYAPPATNDNKVRFICESLTLSVFVVIEKTLDNWEIFGPTGLWVKCKRRDGYTVNVLFESREQECQWHQYRINNKTNERTRSE